MIFGGVVDDGCGVKHRGGMTVHRTPRPKSAAIALLLIAALPLGAARIPLRAIAEPEGRSWRLRKPACCAASRPALAEQRAPAPAASGESRCGDVTRSVRPCQSVD